MQFDADHSSLSSAEVKNACFFMATDVIKQKYHISATA
jgi:hypothetical protein